MTFEELTLALFAACNSIRIFAYVPQIYKAATDENGAAAISCTTWFLFLVAHLSTIAYALVNQSDWGLAACFAANAACCAAILAITVSKRRAAAATLLEEGSRASEDFDDDSRSSANGGCFSTNNLRIGTSCHDRALVGDILLHASDIRRFGQSRATAANRTDVLGVWPI